jgi:hypothetical protein
MITKTKLTTFLSLNLIAAGMIFVSGHFTEAAAQKDPFAKPAWARTRENRGGTGTGAAKKTATAATNLSVPAIDTRIEYYKRQREAAAANGSTLPKVTSVLTVDEMAVTGIFKTPRGYAAMVEAVPIKLSYTIYPGDRFFDGQLVAVEENRLVFRKVTKMSNGKFVSSVENKALRQFTVEQTVQGTAPTQGEPQSAQAMMPATMPEQPKAPAGPIVSPLEEMNKQVAPNASAGDAKKTTKKTVKVAKKNK